MVAEPDFLTVRWVEASRQLVIVHAEACRHLHRTLAAIGDAHDALTPPGTPER